MRRSVVASLVLVGFAWRSAFADCDAEELVGYTILARTSVNGDFEGCDFDRVIRYANGMKTTRAGYSYTSPMAATRLFTRGRRPASARRTDFAVAAISRSALRTSSTTWSPSSSRFCIWPDADDRSKFRALPIDDRDAV